jgi:hypothetical protein
MGIQKIEIPVHQARYMVTKLRLHSSALMLLLSCINLIQILSLNGIGQVNPTKSPLINQGDLGGCVFLEFFTTPLAPFSKGDFMHAAVCKTA